MSPAGLGRAIPGARGKMLLTKPQGPCWSESPSWRRWGLEGWRELPIRRGGEGHRRRGASSLGCLLTLPKLPVGREAGRPPFYVVQVGSQHRPALQCPGPGCGATTVLAARSNHGQSQRPPGNVLLPAIPLTRPWCPRSTCYWSLRMPTAPATSGRSPLTSPMTSSATAPPTATMSGGRGSGQGRGQG